MKTLRRYLAMLIVLCLVMCQIPTQHEIKATDVAQYVQVIVENMTYTTEEGAPWHGELFSKQVELKADTTMLTAIDEAVKDAGYTISGVDTAYITEINGIAAFDSGAQSGWMATLNDWFTNQGANAYTVADGTLVAGDVIRMEYTEAWGADIGGDWSSTDMGLSQLAISKGQLSPVFDKATKDYTLTIPEDTASVIVSPRAVNRNNLVKIYKGENTTTGYRVGSTIEVAHGDTLRVIVGVGAANSTEYTIHITREGYVEPPLFEAFEFTASALTNWTANSTFSPTTYEYQLNIKLYSTSSLTVTNKTKYDATKYKAVAIYTDNTGQTVETEIKSGAYSYLRNLDFGQTRVVVTLSEIDNPSNATEYVFHVTRPYDTNAQLGNTTGIILNPEGRTISAMLYQGDKEGTMYQLDNQGNPTGTKGIKKDVYHYKTFVYKGLQGASLTLKGGTAYVCIRIKEEGGEFIEVKSNANTPVYSLEDVDSKNFIIQTISQEEYMENGFANVDTVGYTYHLQIEIKDIDLGEASILQGSFDHGQPYPKFASNQYSYNVVIDNNDAMPVFTFTVPTGATVTVGNTLQTPVDGVYKTTLSTSASQIKVSSAHGLEATYSIKAIKRSGKYDVPNQVVDYLCVNSQYTNATSYGMAPETTLGGTLKSIGGFGGYITYYYEEPIKNDPHNKYGMDFYVYGNSFANGGSAAENGQVYVSPDGVNWYALAGSEHYEPTTLWDYSITYTKNPSGKIAWTDNQGGSKDGSSQTGAWPLADNYYMNDLAKADSITLKGILLPCADGSLYGDGSTNAFSCPVSFGYADYFKNGTIGEDKNPYIDGAESNGFDLSWAVDEQGYPVDLSQGVHYIKVVTAQNIWAGGFNEKSTEITYVTRTTPQTQEVGKTQSPTSLWLEDSYGQKLAVDLKDGIYEYSLKIGDVKEIGIAAQGTADNIYVNNQRVAPGELAQVTLQGEETIVRVIMQQGDMEPVIYYLTLSSDTKQKALDIYTEVTEAFQAKYAPQVNSIGGEWMVLGLSRYADLTTAEEYEYFETAYKYVEGIGSSKLHRTKVTDNDRVILALASRGYDVTDMAGYNLLAPLADYTYVKKQGLNGPIWTLIALDSREYEIPQAENNATQTTRELLIQEILAGQNSQGAFSLDGKTGSVDLTAMALTALAPYAKDNREVQAAVDQALDYLSRVQHADGSFHEGALEDVTRVEQAAVEMAVPSNTESTAQVIVALTALGIDPCTDSRFVKAGNSVMAGLCDFYLGNGAFAHMAGEGANQMATEQAYLALVAYRRFVDGKSAIYTYQDVPAKANPKVNEPTTEAPTTGATTTATTTTAASTAVSTAASTQEPTTSTAVENPEAPKTGDSTPIWLFMALFILGIGGMIYSSKKDKHIGV